MMTRLALFLLIIQGCLQDLHPATLSNPYTLAWANDSALSDYVVNGVIASMLFEIPKMPK